MVQIAYDLIVQENGQPDEKTISAVELVNAKLSHNVGEAPQATAGKGGEPAPNYEIAYEYWGQMETNGEGYSVPVAFWYSDAAKNNTVKRCRTQAGRAD